MYTTGSLFLSDSNMWGKHLDKLFGQSHTYVTYMMGLKELTFTNSVCSVNEKLERYVHLTFVQSVARETKT